MAPPPTELQAQSARYTAVRVLAARQLTGLWPQVDWSSDHATDAVTALYRAVTTRFGAMSATLAANFYDAQRDQKDLRLRYRATVSAPADATHVGRIVTSAFRGDQQPLDVHQRRRVSHVRTNALPVEQRVPQRLDAALSRLVLQPARDTIAANVAADPVKPTWLRVPTGETTCEFCIMLASRELGPHFRGYSTRERALFKANGEKFHNECDCQAVVRFPGDDPHVLSPNMPQYFAIYRQGATAARSSDTKAVLAGMRKVLKTTTVPPGLDPPTADQADVVDLDA